MKKLVNAILHSSIAASIATAVCNAHYGGTQGVIVPAVLGIALAVIHALTNDVPPTQGA